MSRYFDASSTPAPVEKTEKAARKERFARRKKGGRKRNWRDGSHQPAKQWDAAEVLAMLGQDTGRPVKP